MLIQYAHLNALDDAAKARLRASLSGLLQTAESVGYVMFEGQYYSLASIQMLAAGRTQFLRESK